MKSKKWVGLILALIVVLATTSTVSAKSERIEFTFTEFCDPGTVQITREIMNGQGNWLVRHWTQTCYETATIDQWTGVALIDLNMNLTGSHDFVFFVGKARFVSSKEGGVWNMNCLYPVPSVDVQCVGIGEGFYEGQQIFIKFEPGVGGGGYIVDHGQ